MIAVEASKRRFGKHKYHVTYLAVNQLNVAFVDRIITLSVLLHKRYGMVQKRKQKQKQKSDFELLSLYMNIIIELSFRMGWDGCRVASCICHCKLYKKGPEGTNNS